MTDKAPGNFELLWLHPAVSPRCARHPLPANPVDTCLSIYFANFSAQQDYACDRGDLVFYYRQYERLMDHWRACCRPIASPKWSTRRWSLTGRPRRAG